MRKIKAESVDAFNWLDQLEVKTWAFHAMDPRVKCDHVTSNFVESFNAWVGEDRFKPPIALLESIRSKIMNLIYTRQQTAATWNQYLTPDVSARIRKLTTLSRHAEVRRSQEYEFEVELNELHVGVKLDEGKCDCNAWQMKGIPCVHALACIVFIRANVHEYVERYFTTETWKKTFLGVVHPIPSRIY